MTSLEIIEEFLNIELGDRKLCDGKHKTNKNKYYYFKRRYYIVQINDMWFIMSDCKRTRKLLRKYTWSHMGSGYIFNGSNKLYLHRKITKCKDDLVVDHINRYPYDNRDDNLRCITSSSNSRNRTISCRNTSGRQGVIKCTMRDLEYWKARICNNDGRRIVKCFSIAKMGDEMAKKYAILQRRLWEVEFDYMDITED